MRTLGVHPQKALRIHIGSSSTGHWEFIHIKHRVTCPIKISHDVDAAADDDGDADDDDEEEEDLTIYL